MSDIGKNIRELREQKGLTQEDLAARLFVTRQTLSNYENKKTRPDIEMLLKIAEELDTDINTVIYGIATSNQRHQEQCRLVIGGIALIFTLVCTAVVHHFDKADMTYDITLRFFVCLVLLPVFWCLLGWTFVQGAVLLTKPKPLNFSWVKYAKFLILVLIAAYVVVILPHVIFEIICSIEFYQNESYSMSLPLENIYDWILLKTEYFVSRCPQIFALLGGMFRVFEFPSSHQELKEDQ